MRIKKSHIYNLLFIAFFALLLYPNTRTWFLRQLAFSPSVTKVENRSLVSDYNWQLKGLNTADYNLTMGKDKVVFINFWATWCPPCRAEMPMIQELYDEYKDKVEFLFVTTDSKNEVEKFYSKNNYNLPTYNMLEREPTQIATTSLPTTYLIDKKGRIVISKTGAADWNSNSVKRTIDELLSE